MNLNQEVNTLVMRGVTCMQTTMRVMDASGPQSEGSLHLGGELP